VCHNVPLQLSLNFPEGLTDRERSGCTPPYTVEKIEILRMEQFAKATNSVSASFRHLETVDALNELAPLVITIVVLFFKQLGQGC
jgi:hypothetical protein